MIPRGSGSSLYIEIEVKMWELNFRTGSQCMEARIALFIF